MSIGHAFLPKAMHNLIVDVEYAELMVIGY